MFSSIIIAYLARTFFMASRLRPDNFLFDRMLPLLSILNLVQVSLISWNPFIFLPNHLIIVVNNMENIVITFNRIRPLDLLFLNISHNF